MQSEAGKLYDYYYYYYLFSAQGISDTEGEEKIG